MMIGATQGRKGRRRAALFAGISLSFVAQQFPHIARAANLYWDTNGITVGAGGTAPSGVWDLSTTDWTLDGNGGPNPPGLWVNDGSSTAIFAAGVSR